MALCQHVLFGIKLQGDLIKDNQAVWDTLHVTFFDQSYVTSVEAMADNFVVGF